MQGQIWVEVGSHATQTT